MSPGLACPPGRLSRRGVLALGLRPDGDGTMTGAQQRKSGRMPLPKGWTFFSSQPDSINRAYWYVASPYPVDALKAQNGRTAQPLCHTVTAPSWSALQAEVAAQAELYERLIGETGG
ncbi:hypothetical protein ACWEKM_36080 [Streptomyces sp. NPDC004752]